MKDSLACASRKSKSKVLVHVIGLIVVLILIIVGIYCGYAYKAGSAVREKEALTSQIDGLKKAQESVKTVKATGKEYINNDLGFSFIYSGNLIAREGEFLDDIKSQTIYLELPGEKVSLEAGQPQLPNFRISVFTDKKAFLKQYNASSLESYFQNNPTVSKCTDKEMNGKTWKACDEVGLGAYKSLYLEENGEVFRLITEDINSAVYTKLLGYMNQVAESFQIIKQLK